MKQYKIILAAITLASVVLSSCRMDPDVKPGSEPALPEPTPYALRVPKGFSQPKIPADNPMTVEGVELGRLLFYDPILSGDSSMSCATCHRQENAFASNSRVEKGITGGIGTRNSMPLFNLAWHNTGFFWDGRAATLEEQVTHPVENPIEMKLKWEEAIKRIKRHPDYPELYREAFPKEGISKETSAKALAQFIRTLVSADSKYDRYTRGEVQLTDAELRGLKMTNVNEKADCGHCHEAPLFANLPMDNSYRNNGLTETNTLEGFRDIGLGGVTGNPSDYGRFKVASLRNLGYTSPYMHDGSMPFLENVVMHYNNGGKSSPTLDPNMPLIHHSNSGGSLNLTQQDMQDLIAFLNTLNDPKFVTNPEFSNPH